MAHSLLSDRVRAIQELLNVEVDGMIGPETITALEKRLEQQTPNTYLTVSKKGLHQLLNQEMSSRGYYKKFLARPHWLGGHSGVQIGLGYDLGYSKPKQIRQDWGNYLQAHEIESLIAVSGLIHQDAHEALDKLNSIEIPFNIALEVFYDRMLPRVAEMAVNTYPGIAQLAPDAQSALLSLIFNRGCKLNGQFRKEMSQLRGCVASADYEAISDKILDMRRIWEVTGNTVLIKRRYAEARLVRGAQREYSADELISI